jgi:hypothetical protein
MRKPVNRWSTRLLKKPLLCFSFALLLCMFAYVYQSANGSHARSSFAASTPVEVGNRVWLDKNGNGLQDNGEPGISNVTVHLYGSDGKLEETEVTDTSGHYAFTISPDASYQIRLDKASDYASGGPLHGDQLTVADSDCQHVKDSRAMLSDDSQSIGANNYPQVTVDQLVAGQSNDNFNIGFTPAKVVAQNNGNWSASNCSADDTDRPVPTAGLHPIPTATCSPNDADRPVPTVGLHPQPSATCTPTPPTRTKKSTPTPAPKKPVTLPTKTAPTAFPKLPATGSNPYGVVLP